MKYLYIYRATVRDGCRPFSFEISNQPSWASFNEHNGRLVGKPNQDDIGVYQDVQIDAVDSAGQIASTGPFTIRVIPRGGDIFSPSDLNLVVRYSGNGFDVEIENSLINLMAPRMPRDEFFTM